MVSLDVGLGGGDELVVGVAADDLATLAVDQPRHRLLLRSLPPHCHRRELRIPCRTVGETLAAAPDTRIQLCGHVVALLEGRRVEEALPGRQGRLLFAYLVLNRLRPSPRAELVAALWAQAPPAGADSALSALLSKLRVALGAERLEGRGELRLVLPPDARVDVEAAAEALHRAESCVARAAWAEAWGPARVALHVTTRVFLAGHEAPWVEEERRRLAGLRLRALECVAASSLGLRGSELAAAERAARALVEAAPFRDSGHRYLMRALAAGGNAAEALVVYERFRTLLRDELGAAPDAATRELHRALLAATAGGPGEI